MAILGRINQMMKKEEKMTISGLLDPRLVTFLNVANCNEALRALVNLLDKEGKLLNRQAFLRAILEREKIVSTGIGMGVALPHAKLEECEEFFIAVGVLHEKGLDWNSLDGVPVRAIFMIGGPVDKQTSYLHLLSQLTQVIKEEEKRKQLFKAKTPQEVISLFEGY